MKLSVRAGLVAGALSAALVGTGPLVAAPAAASSMGMFRSSGTVANASWVEFGTLPGIGGNVHVGSLAVDASSTTSAYVFGNVADWTCPDGQRPPEGGTATCSRMSHRPSPRPTARWSRSGTSSATRRSFPSLSTSDSPPLD